jgi:Ca2+-binding EF-hand superfamily protein
MRRITGRLILLMGVLCVAVGAGSATAQTGTQPKWKEAFQLHDKNSDGRIDRAEFQDWMVDVFFQRDQGRKGYLTLDDVKGIMTPEVFAAANRKKDGKLWLGEFLNTLFQDFDAMDVHQNGSITTDEIDAYIQHARK